MDTKNTEKYSLKANYRVFLRVLRVFRVLRGLIKQIREIKPSRIARRYLESSRIARRYLESFFGEAREVAGIHLAVAIQIGVASRAHAPGTHQDTEIA